MAASDRGPDDSGRIRFALDAAGVGTLTIRGDIVEVGKVAADLLGGAPGTIEALLGCLHPADARIVHRLLTTSAPGDTQVRVSKRWLHLWLSEEHDDTRDAALLDITRMKSEQAAVWRVLESMSTAYVALDQRWRYQYVNAEAERVLRRSRDDLLGREMWEAFPAMSRQHRARYERAATTGKPVLFESYYPAPLKAWLEVRAVPTEDGMSLYFLDITARRRSRELLELSADIADQMTATLDTEQAVRSLAEAVVPRLADWSIVTLTEPGGGLRDLASWHADPAMRPVVARYTAMRYAALDDEAPIWRAFRSATPIVVEHDLVGVVSASLHDESAKSLLRALAPESSVIAPMTAHGKMRGILNLVRGADRRPFTPEEVGVVRTIAHRAALALDNARLYAEQRAFADRLADANERLTRAAEHDRSVATALQGAMLPTLPSLPGLELAARYRTATGFEQVGGDWYDALRLPTGATALVIGDVEGHDIDAATRMAQLRNLLRAFAWDHDEPPAALLSRLDRALRELGIDALATAVLAVLSRSRGRDGEAGLRWTSAGHPAPVLVVPGESPRFLSGRNDLLLGVDPTRPRRDQEEILPSGATLLLYTDGLTEARGRDLVARDAQLLDAVRRCAEAPLEELLDRVLADLIGDQRQDDVALLGVRLLRID
jgi:PAS domain S-box-containing protein